MHSLRFLVVSTIITLPFSAFAQTATTTAVQPPDMMQERAAAQVQIDAMAQEYIDSFATPRDINLKALTDDVNIKTTPQDPGPNETVTVTLVGYLADLGRASIDWSVNGKVVSSGVGQKLFTFQNGRSGETTTIRTTIVTATGEQLSKSFSFTPIGTTVLWEADTYTPPFYKGKPLLSPEARVRVIAIPDIGGIKNSLTAGDFVYVWKKDGMVQADTSGFRKNSFSFIAPLPLNKTGVSVNISSLTGSMQSKRTIDVPLFNPLILFYEKHPLLGVWYNRPFGTDITLNNKEFSISAEPYFFSNETSDTPTLKYDWTINGNSTQNFGHTITLRNDTGAKGDSSISLAMRGLKQTFQSAGQTLNVHFTESAVTGRPTF